MGDDEKQLNVFAQNLFCMYHVQSEGRIKSIERGLIFDRALYESINKYNFEHYKLPHIDFEDNNSIIRCLQSDQIWDHVVRKAIVMPELGTDNYQYRLGLPFYRGNIKIPLKTPLYPEFRDFVIMFRGEMES